MHSYVIPTALLLISNTFMTLAWYGHLKFTNRPLWIVIFASWGIALVEYIFQVPANRYGFTHNLSAATLKVIQEVVTLAVFAVFAVVWMRERLHLNHVWAALCLVAAVFFTFRR